LPHSCIECVLHAPETETASPRRTLELVLESTPVPAALHREKREMRGEGERAARREYCVRRRRAQPEKEGGKPTPPLPLIRSVAVLRPMLSSGPRMPHDV
jgi:hypothetical protein